jgi:hypothetical protein
MSSCSSAPRVVPPSVGSLFAHARRVGFSGSRAPLAAPSLAASRVSLSVWACRFAEVGVGCAPGVDAAVRGACPRAVVFRASSFGSGPGSFAARSVALVRWVAACPVGSLFVSFPSSPCPAGLVPCSSSSVCFRGLGSGSWASLAFAVGLGVPSLVWLPAGVPVPPGWVFSAPGPGPSVAPWGGAWWLVSAPAVQLSLF